MNWNSLNSVQLDARQQISRKKMSPFLPLNSSLHKSSLSLSNPPSLLHKTFFPFLFFLPSAGQEALSSSRKLNVQWTTDFSLIKKFSMCTPQTETVMTSIQKCWLPSYAYPTSPDNPISFFKIINTNTYKSFIYKTYLLIEHPPQTYPFSSIDWAN